MPKFLMAGIVLFLLLAAAGYGLTTLQARSIPWDCSDWQAFAHEDRTTAILESLAENRGKTLYCGIDQSDTFTKAETWEAGKDRNERDDTVYFGERGQFRGFIAAQEGWLTDGESGVTGVSIDRIFEFPREERRRTKRVKRFDVGTTLPDDDAASCGQGGGLICSGWGDWAVGGYETNHITQKYKARNRAALTGVWKRLNWETNILTSYLANGNVNVANAGNGTPSLAWWQGQAEATATAACRARGARYVAGSAEVGPGHNNDNDGSSDGRWYSGGHLGWFYDYRTHNTNPAARNYRAQQSRTWTATCKKTVRRTRK